MPPLLRDLASLWALLPRAGQSHGCAKAGGGQGLRPHRWRCPALCGCRCRDHRLRLHPRPILRSLMSTHLHTQTYTCAGLTVLLVEWAEEPRLSYGCLLAVYWKREPREVFHTTMMLTTLRLTCSTQVRFLYSQFPEKWDVFSYGRFKTISYLIHVDITFYT